MIIKIDEKFAGETIKKVLFDKLGFSRGAITELKKKEHGIEVNSEHKTVRYVLQFGDELFLDLSDDAPSERINKSNGKIDIIFEDDSMIVLNKPPFLAVHPSKKIQDDTLAGRLLAVRPNLVFRAMGRLDKNTSGVVVCGKTRVMSAKLFDLVSKRNVKKEYLLVTCGSPLPKSGKITLGIRRDDKSYIKRICIPENEALPSEAAETEFRVISEKDDFKLIVASPITGRTHQLRAHFSALGNPIVGDDMYGEASNLASRQLLHAFCISFLHPETEKPLKFVAPLFPDMQKIIFDIFGIDPIDCFPEKQPFSLQK